MILDDQSRTYNIVGFTLEKAWQVRHVGLLLRGIPFFGRHGVD